MYTELKERVLLANKKLVEYNLVTLTWGNVSEIDRELGVVAIKPSGVDYSKMTSEDIVIVNLEGKRIEGKLNPSSDLATHLHIYSMCEAINSIVHTHSMYATSYAQAGRDVMNYGTTHADHFQGTIPCTRVMRDDEIKNNYEHNTGVVIQETFNSRGIDPSRVMACIVNNHGPFAWGSTTEQAVENALVLEVVAKMNLQTELLNGKVTTINKTLEDKHYLRKHGSGAYYGQQK